MNIPEIALTIAVIGLVTAFFTWKAKRSQADSWTGEVIKKKVHNDEESGRTQHQLIVKTSTGQKKKFNVHQESFAEVRIGDKFEKVAGELHPKRVS